MQKYYNPRLHNAVVAGTGMEHPRRPHVVLGSELNGYVQGDLVDANGICDLIHEKNVDTFAKLEALETSLKNESKARVEGMDNLSEQIDRTIAEKLGSTETVYGESVQRAAEDERLQYQINDLNSKYTALGNSLSTLNTTVNGKQDALVAGNNIKNINDGTNTVSLLGAGDIRFKTINGQSILGDEDIPVAAGGGSTIISIDQNTTFAELQAAIQAAPDKENVYITNSPNTEEAAETFEHHFTIAKINPYYSQETDEFGNPYMYVFENDAAVILASGSSNMIVAMPKSFLYTIDYDRSIEKYMLRDSIYGGDSVALDIIKVLPSITNVISYNGVRYYLHAVNTEFEYSIISSIAESSEEPGTKKAPTLKSSGAPISSATLYSIYKRVDTPDESSDLVVRGDDLPNTFYICSNGIYTEKDLGAGSQALEVGLILGDMTDTSDNKALFEFWPYRYGSITDYYVIHKHESSDNNQLIFYSKSTDSYLFVVVSNSTGTIARIQSVPGYARYALKMSFSGNYTINTVRDTVTGELLNPYEVHLYTDTIVNFNRNNSSMHILKLSRIMPDGMIGSEWDGTTICSWYSGPDENDASITKVIPIGAFSENVESPT